METEAETLDSRSNFRSRADKLNGNSGIQITEAETSPLLGPLELSNKPKKRWYNTPSIFWLLPAFVFKALIFGATIAPRVNLFLSLTCDDYYSERISLGLPGPLPGGAYPVVVIGQQNPDCHVPEIQARASRLALAMGLCSGIISAMTTGKYGALSDRRGRRLVILIALCGTIIHDVVIILMAKYWRILGLEFFLVGAILDGLFGSFTTTMAATNAYIADCTSPERRAVSFAYIHSIFFLGIAVGPATGSFIIGLTGNSIVVFYCALAVHAAYAVYILFFVPESVTKEHMLEATQKYKARNASSAGIPYSFRNWRYWTKFLNVFQPLEILWPQGSGHAFKAKRRNLITLTIVDAILLFHFGAVSIIILYPTYMFNWGALESGYYLSVVGSVRVLVLLFLLPLIVRIFRGPHSATRSTTKVGADNLDVWLIRLCPLIEMIGFLCMANAKTTSQFYVSGALTALGAFGSPTLHSALTKHVAKEEVGRLLGALSLLGSISRIVSPLVLNLLYSFTVGTYPQTIFYVLSASMFIGFVMSWGVKPHVSVDVDNLVHEDEDE